MSKTVVAGDKAHSVLGASSASRWMACAASVTLSAGLESSESKFAREGTLAHAWGEYALRHGLVGLTVGDTLKRHGVDCRDNDVPLTQDMARAVEEYIRHVWSIYSVPGATRKLYVESCVDLSKLISELPPEYRPFGTCDAIIHEPEAKSLHVIDYKHGAGIPVSAVDNVQIKFYALGALMAFEGRDVQTVTVTIVQPRAPIDGEAVRSETLDAMDLMEWGLFELRPAAIAAANKNADAVPGPHCRFCKAAGRTCGAFESRALAAAADAFDDIEAPGQIEPGRIDPDTLAEKLAKVDILESWCSKLREIADNEARNGNIPSGYKWVQGRGRRQWNKDDDQTATEAKALTGVDITERVTLSPAKAEKLLGKKDFGKIAALVGNKPGSPQLVKLSDKRPAIDLKELAGSEFERITLDE